MGRRTAKKTGEREAKERGLWCKRGGRRWEGVS